jgi:hypothetical protein
VKWSQPLQAERGILRRGLAKAVCGGPNGSLCTSRYRERMQMKKTRPPKKRFGAAAGRAEQVT